MALMALCDGNSLITETVFENRLRHVAELNRMGADIRLNGNCAVIKGCMGSLGLRCWPPICGPRRRWCWRV
jgi:UDP-N-acetylglucosamine 1-carboxyvinyltransferase